MKADPEEGVLRPFDFSQIIGEVPELAKFAVRIDTFTFDPLIDSSDVEPSMWQELTRLIAAKYDDYDGFVILHGTDTMAYSASALSFMLEGLGKPVVFTGSQLPIGVPRTDGKENLIGAVEIAAARDADGKAMVPEVCIWFDSRLIRGNRAVKTSSENFDAFKSPNYPYLAEAGINIRYNRPYILEVPEGGLRPRTELDTRVSILKIHPGITREVVRNVILGPESRAVILETYGSGNAPAKPWFLDLVEEATSAGKIIVNVTQCLTGNVDMRIYATGKALMKRGVLSGYDSTTESALGKLFCLLGRNPRNEDAARLLETNLRGEITK